MKRWTSAAVAGTVFVAVVVAGIEVRASFAPTCATDAPVLLDWEGNAPGGAARPVDPLTRPTFTIVGEHGRVRVDAVLYRDTGGFVIPTMAVLYAVREGTTADLIDEAVHPYGPVRQDGPGGSTAPADVDATTTTQPRSTTTRPPGWQPRAIVSGDIVRIGLGTNDINEEATLGAGNWHLDASEPAKLYRVTVRACGS